MRAKHPDLLTGNHPAGRRRLTALPTATAADAVPRAPKGLGPVGQRAWQRLWRAAGPAWQPATDSYMVEMFCSLLDRRSEFRATLDKDGWIASGSRGQDAPHPVARLLHETEKMLVPLTDRLGLSPESRIRLGLASARTASVLEEFLGPEG